MKSVFATFIAAFLVFGVIGYFKGRVYMNRPEVIQREAFRQVELLCSNDYELEALKRKCKLVYPYEGVLLYSFDIDKGALDKSPEATKLEMQAGTRVIQNFPIDEELFLTLLGGSTAGYKIKDVLSSERSPKKIQQIIWGSSWYYYGLRAWI